MRLMNEIVSGIQVIKMYAWEKPFAMLVEVARRYVIWEFCMCLLFNDAANC
jgi:ATP-binding cassette subfamily C (CFTR/MRP) protein 4